MPRDRGRPSSRRPSPEQGIGGGQVEGRQAVRELLRAGRRPVHQLFVLEGAEDSEAVAEILDLADSARVAARRVGRSQIDSMAQSDAPQGVVARAGDLPEADLDDLTRVGGEIRPFLVVLDGVTDPHNMGAVMRSALSAGATGLVIPRHRTARLTPSAVKAAAGAVEYLPVATVAGIPAALADLVRAGVWTVGLDGGADRTLWDLEVASEPVALVMGAEGRGLARLTRQRCDLTVEIPMSGPLDSLNVSAAATLACFEVARRRSQLSD